MKYNYTVVRIGRRSELWHSHRSHWTKENCRFQPTRKEGDKVIFTAQWHLSTHWRVLGLPQTVDVGASVSCRSGDCRDRAAITNTR
jgi:hypothetical protein